jgi:predicted TIM-barrel fold metal-dependent hydrolase
VFERFPRLRFVVTETGCAWVPPLLKTLDSIIDQIRRTGQTGEIRYGEEHKLNRLASEYFAQNVWMGVSQPRPGDIAARASIGAERFMWGSDYPHDEGTYPFTRETLRQVFADMEHDEKQRYLAENCAKLYDFDLAKLAPLAVRFGPTVEELDRPLTDLPENPNDALLRSVVRSS